MQWKDKKESSNWKYYIATEWEKGKFSTIFLKDFNIWMKSASFVLLDSQYSTYSIKHFGN